ncbi:MAG: hypothetical protein ACKO35_13145 [Planctomycetaceae bacterium]
MPVRPPAQPPEFPVNGVGGDEVSALMGRVIERLDGRLDPDQRRQLAAAMPAILWEFPDTGARVQLVATPAALCCVSAGDAPSLVVRMPLGTLHDAAFGRCSLAASFLAGRITVRGMSPTRLREFILLVDPLLESFREAAREHSSPAAPAPDVS